MPLRAIETATYTNGTSRTIAMPAAAEVGDFATLLVVCIDAISTDLSPDGWTLHGETSPPTSTGYRVTAWTKPVTAPDIGATLTIDKTGAASSRWAMALMVRHGVTGLDTAPAFTTAVTESITVTAPSITTMTDSAELVCVYGCQPDTNGNFPTFTMPIGQTEVADICSAHATGSNATMAIGEEVLEAAGSSGTRSATADNTVRTAAMTFAYAVTTASSSSTIQVRQGGVWVEKQLRIRAGGTWAMKPLKTRVGGNWL